MKKILYILGLLLLYMNCISQDLLFPEDYDFSNAFALKADFMINSDAITNRFITSYNNGDFLSEDLITDIAGRLNKRNTLGTMSNQEITWYFMLDSLDEGRKHGLIFALTNRSLTEIRFTEPFFSLVFIGNKQYEGQTADLDNMRFNSINYQQIKIGYFVKGKNKHGTTVTSALLAINKGQKNLFVEFKDASLYTAELGEYIDLDVNAKIRMSDTTKNDLLAFNGYGASIDLFYDYTSYKGNKLYVEVSNIGFIRWKNESFNYSRDTVFHYKGWYIKDVFDFNSMIFQERLNDSLLNNTIYQRDERGYNTSLPLSVKINYTHHIIPDKLDLRACFHEMFFTTYQPFLLLQPRILLSKTLQMGVSASYGGYGKFNAGAEISLATKKHFYFMAGSRFLNGLFFPESASGLDYYILINKIF